jgi:hypothetical protein
LARGPGKVVLIVGFFGMAPPAEKYTLSQKIGLRLNSAYIYIIILQ